MTSSPARTCTFNDEALALFAGARSRQEPRLRLADVAEEVGISKAQLWRAIHKQPVNNLAFLKLCAWLGTNPYAFLIDPETGRGLADLPEGGVSRATATETRGKPRKSRAVA